MENAIVLAYLYINMDLMKFGKALYFFLFIF